MRLVLQNLGLDGKQCEAYLALLALGEASMTELAQKAKLKRPTAYLAIEELQLLGLVSQTELEGRKTYAPTHPRRLLEIARSREKQIEKTLPELIALYNTPNTKPRIQVFEGKTGVEMLYKEVYQFLTKKQEALFFTRIDGLKKHMPLALSEYKTTLAKVPDARIRELHYANQAGIDWYDESQHIRERTPNYKIRHLPVEYEFGFTDTLIFGDSVSIFSVKEHVFVIVIESRDIAMTLRALFEAAWQVGTTPY